MAEAQQQGRQGNRPLSVTLVTWGVFLLGLMNVWRAVALYRQSALLLGLGVTLDPRLRILFALIWALIFICISISIWRRWKASRLLTPILWVVYTTNELGLNQFFTQTFRENEGWQSDIVLYAVVLIFIIWALNHKNARYYFN